MGKQNLTSLRDLVPVGSLPHLYQLAQLLTLDELNVIAIDAANDLVNGDGQFLVANPAIRDDDIILYLKEVFILPRLYTVYQIKKLNADLDLTEIEAKKKFLFGLLAIRIIVFVRDHLRENEGVFGRPKFRR